MTETEDNGVDSQETNQTNQTEVTPEDRRRQFQEHIRRWRSSGLTQAEYCRRNELKWSTFHYWRKRLQDTATAVTLVQVPVSNNLSCQANQELISFANLKLTPQ